MLQSNKNFPLIVSGVVIIIIGLIYGLVPDQSIPYFFDFRPETIDLRNILRAQMLLCIGFGAYWLYGAFHESHMKSATISLLIFMGFLALGRFISFLFDGFSDPYFKGFILELALFWWALLTYLKPRAAQQ